MRTKCLKVNRQWSLNLWRNFSESPVYSSGRGPFGSRSYLLYAHVFLLHADSAYYLIQIAECIRAPV